MRRWRRISAQEIDDLDERLLRLVLTCNVGKCHAGLLFHIDLGLVLTEAAAETAAVAHALAQIAEQENGQEDHGDREEQVQQRQQERVCLLRKLGAVGDAERVELLGQLVRILIGDQAGVIIPLLLRLLRSLVLREDHHAVVRFKRDLADLVFLEPLLELRIADLGQIGIGDHIDHGVDEQRRNDSDHEIDPEAVASAAVTVAGRGTVPVLFFRILIQSVHLLSARA